MGIQLKISASKNQLAFLRLYTRPIFDRLVSRLPLCQGLGRLPYKTLVIELGLRFENLAELLKQHPFIYSNQSSLADFANYGSSTTSFSGATPKFAGSFYRRNTFGGMEIKNELLNPKLMDGCYVRLGRKRRRQNYTTA